MLKITLICGGGYSSSMLVSDIRKIIEEEDLQIEIRASAESKVSLYEEDSDILLLAPQVRYLEKDFKEKYEKQGIRVMVVNSMDYGLMNGRKVLKDTLEQYNK